MSLLTASRQNRPSNFVRAVAAVSRAVDLHLDWASNVKNGVRALLEFLAAEPAYAHLACVDVLIAYPRLARRLDEANHSVGRRYEQLRRLLAEQLGLEPESATRALYYELLGQR